MAKTILKGVGILAAPFTGGASLALTAGASLLGGKKKAAATPAPTAGPLVMPLADDEKIKAAKRRSVAAQLQRGGRSSTILSGSPSETLGG